MKYKIELVNFYFMYNMFFIMVLSISFDLFISFSVNL